MPEQCPRCSARVPLVVIKAVKPKDLERVIVDTTVQEKAIAHPTDVCWRSPATRWQALRWRAGGYAHAKQFRRLKRVLKRQRTILGIVMREVQRKMQGADFAPDQPKAVSDLSMWLGRAGRIRTQQRTGKNKLYALHAPEVECIGKGRARKPYEFGVKSAVVVSHKDGLMLAARTFPGNPYDGHILSAVLEQATHLMQDVRATIKDVVVDLGFRGVDADNPNKQIIHRGETKSLNAQQKGLAQTAPGSGAGHRALEVRSPHGSLLAAGRAGRRVACPELRCGLQLALAAARNCPSGHKGSIFAPAARCVVGTKGHRSVIRPTGPLRDSAPERLARQSDGCQSTDLGSRRLRWETASRILQGRLCGRENHMLFAAMATARPDRNGRITTVSRTIANDPRGRIIA